MSSRLRATFVTPSGNSNEEQVACPMYKDMYKPDPKFPGLHYINASLAEDWSRLEDLRKATNTTVRNQRGDISSVLQQEHARRAQEALASAIADVDSEDLGDTAERAMAKKYKESEPTLTTSPPVLEPESACESLPKTTQVHM